MKLELHLDDQSHVGRPVIIKRENICHIQLAPRRCHFLLKFACDKINVTNNKASSLKSPLCGYKKQLFDHDIFITELRSILIQLFDEDG